MGSLLQNASSASLTLGSLRLCYNITPPNSPQTGHAVDVVILHFTREFSLIPMGSLLQNASFASPTLGLSRLCHNIAPPNSPHTGHAVGVVIVHVSQAFSLTLMGSLLQNAGFASLTLGSSRLCHNIARPHIPQTGHAVDVVILRFT